MEQSAPVESVSNHLAKSINFSDDTDKFSSVTYILVSSRIAKLESIAKGNQKAAVSETA